MDKRLPRPAEGPGDLQLAPPDAARPMPGGLRGRMLGAASWYALFFFSLSSIVFTFIGLLSARW
jgi:hypothetical protein